MALASHLRKLLLNKPQLFYQVTHGIKPKFNLVPPLTWNFGKTLVTSNVYFKSDNDKSKSLVNQNENKIAETKEIEEKDKPLILMNPKTKRYECPYEGCSKSYTTNSNLQTHIKKKHLNYKPHKCHHKDCSESFTFQSELEDHINRVHLKPFECEVCGESFGTQRMLDSHKASIHEKDMKLVKCPNCDEKFKNPKELDTHIRKFHVVTDHRCPKCNMYCTTKGNLNKHIDKCLNNRKFKCEECGEAFFEKRHLDDHMRYKHSDERNYVCDVEGCGAAFKSEPALKQHMRSHSDEKPHQCPYCKEAYKTNQDLRTHVFKIHPEEYNKENDPKVEE